MVGRLSAVIRASSTVFPSAECFFEIADNIEPSALRKDAAML
jgi:hypothetical protein